MGENVQQKNDDLLIHSEYANVSVTLFFHISKMPELGGGPGYIYRTISMVDRAEKLKIDEIEKERQKLATAYHLSIDDVKPITAQAAELLKAPLNGIAN